MCSDRIKIKEWRKKAAEHLANSEVEENKQLVANEKKDDQR